MITAVAEQKEPYSLHSVARMSDGNVAEVFQSLLTNLTFNYTTHASSVLCQRTLDGSLMKHLTLYGVPRRRLASLPWLVTDPLLAALPRDFDPAWCLAPHARGLRLCAQTHAANGAVHAHALVLAARREALPIAVDDAVVFAARSRHI